MATAASRARARRASRGSRRGSRTTRTSKGNETVSQTVNRAKKMLGSAYNPNTKRPSRSRLDQIANQDFVTKENRDAYYASRPITPESIGNKVEPYQPPAAPPVTDLTGQSNQINAMLAGAMGGTYDSANGFVNPPTTDTTGEKGFEDLFKSYMGTQEQLNADRPSQEAFTREMQAELRPKENLVNSLQNRLQSIADTAKEKQLGLEGQGRGITDTLIGGQQARIGRDAAIESLQFQTQLAAAQGDLDSARSYLGQLYAAKSADVQAEYQYKSNLASSIYGFLNSQQQRRVDAATKEQDRAFGVSQANLAYQRQLGLQALEYGQQGLITGISSVDPSSPTFEQDMAAYSSQLVDPMRGLQMEQMRASIANTYDQIAARQTAIREKAAAAATEQEQAAVQQEAKTEQKLTIKSVLDGLGEMPGMNDAVGVGFKKTLIGGIPIVSGDALEGSARADFEVAATRLSDMFLVTNLDKMTGILTDKDLEVLRNEGTTIGNFAQSEASWKAERQRLSDMMDRGIRENGITEEQALFWGVIDPTEVQTFNSLWETLPEPN